MGRIEKLKREAINEANQRVLNEQHDITENIYARGEINWQDFKSLVDKYVASGRKDKSSYNKAIVMLDNIHGIWGSKRTGIDDMAEDVGNLLKSGDFRVGHIEINSWLENLPTGYKAIDIHTPGPIISDGSVGLYPTNDNPHKVFATRGAISYPPLNGDDYEQRYNKQVSGLVGKLENYAKQNGYKGVGEEFGPYTIPIKTGGVPITYKQSFFAIT